MGGAGRLTLPGLLQTLSAVLSDGLQEAVAIFRSLDNHHEGLVNKPADDVEDINASMPSWPQIASTASKVQVPMNTDRRRNTCCSMSPSRS